MKKNNIYKLFYIAAIVFAVAFAAALVIDILSGYFAVSSAPAWVTVALRALEFILPGAVLFLVGVTLKQRSEAPREVNEPLPDGKKGALRCLPGITACVLQVILFYLLPLTAGPTDMIGLVFLMILLTFVISALLGAFSGSLIKYFFPVFAAAVFLPTVCIYYNESAFVHSLWYLVDSALGMVLGSVIRLLITRLKGK